jgi:NADPH-dependent ferric siderophore reductase
MADQASLLHQVARHEHVDKKFVRVVFHCLGWASEGFQPDEDTHYRLIPRASRGAKELPTRC